MDFENAMKVTKEVLGTIGSDIFIEDYDGLIVKRLEPSCALNVDSSSSQAQLEISRKQMGMFPYIHADGYIEGDHNNQNKDAGEFFVVQITAYIHKENALYFDPTFDLFTDDEQLVHFSVTKSRENKALDQMGMTLKNNDSLEFEAYYELIQSGSYLIIIKRKGQLVYDLYSVKEQDDDNGLSILNNGFYKLDTQTPVKVNEIIVNDASDSDRQILPFKQCKLCARKIIDSIYEIDAFGRIRDYMEENDKTIKINTDKLGGNYLRFIFSKDTSSSFDNSTGDKKARVFMDKDYSIQIKDKTIKCRLTTEWVSSELGREDKRKDGNFVRALIEIVNHEYADILRIYEDSGDWYLEKNNIFSVLTQNMNDRLVKRYITSLLAKPFVIITGNSGTGKTRIAKQVAQLLKADKIQNWILVPVGADWTDNTKILGYYNPLAEKGKGKYEKTEILKLIELANKNEELPFFIILDEMNLSHVERYFADFLSHMEVPEIPLTLDGCNVSVEYPSNLFIVGTVNIDETTYMFSPKVLDRANVIEFRPDKEQVMDLLLNPTSSDIVNTKGVDFAKAFLKLAKEIRSNKCELDMVILKNAQEQFSEIYSLLEEYGYEFAYRTVKEIRNYLSAAYELTNQKKDYCLEDVVDEQLLQKILPKIHGNRKEIGKMLDELDKYTDEKSLKLSNKKIRQMKKKLETVQYASFI